LLHRQEQFETSSDERLPQAAPNAVLTSKGVKDVVVLRNTVLQQTCVALLRSCAETFAGPPSPAQIQQMRVWDSIVTAQPGRFDTAAPARGRAWNTKKKHTN